MITAVNDGGSSIRLFYAATLFQEGLTVTGYAIYDDATKSAVVSFTDLDDGIYTATMPIVQTNKSASEKYGVLVKENGIPKEFEILLVVF